MPKQKSEAQPVVNVGANQISNDNEWGGAEPPNLFASNDNDQVIGVVRSEIPQATNDNTFNGMPTEQEQIFHTKERLGILSEVITENPALHVEVPVIEHERVAEKIAAENIEVVHQPEQENEQVESAPKTAAAGGGRKKPGEDVGNKKPGGKTPEKDKASDGGTRPAGKLMKFIKGVGFWVWFVVGGIVALAFRSLHAATGKILSASGAGGGSKGSGGAAKKPSGGGGGEHH